MSLHCPICKTASLESTQLEAGLQAAHCTSCLGEWITSANYFAYLASLGSDTGVATHASLQPPNESDAPPMPAADSASLKLCPNCGKFMHYYPIGHGISFGIDKCNTCGGVWLNQGEWSVLEIHNLHTKLHAISSNVWQAAFRREARATTDRAALLRHLGADDLAELDRVTAWIHHHPHRDVLLSHLQQQLRGVNG